MRPPRPQLSLALLISTGSLQASDLTGTWRHHREGPEGSSLIEVTLRQTGETVTGYTVEDGSGPGVRRWESCVRGTAKGTRVTVRACSVNQGGSGAVVACPELGPANDQFVLQDGKLLWFTRSGTQWSHYQTLRAAAPTETVDCP